MTKPHIIIHKHGEEGAMLIDALDGTIMTTAEELPVWAEGYAAAMLAERVGWYEKRLGSHLPEGLREPEVLNVHDLSWIGVDTHGDEVEIECSMDFRQGILTTLLEIDTSPESFDELLDNYKIGAAVDFTYETHPSEEQTLREAEGKGFEDTTSTAVNGA